MIFLGILIGMLSFFPAGFLLGIYGMYSQIDMDGPAVDGCMRSVRSSRSRINH